MDIIQKDELGLFVHAGGWICRRKRRSKFKIGDKVKTHHFGDSTIVGVRKDSSCKRGEYIEYWCTTGIGAEENISLQEKKETWNWYKKHFCKELEFFENSRRSKRK
jgi:hypothetical protein